MPFDLFVHILFDSNAIVLVKREMEEKMKHEHCIIIAQRKSNYINAVDEAVKEGKCKECGETIMYGDITFREAQKQVNKKSTKEIQFLCPECYKKMPRFGKLMRPNQEMIEKLRATGMPLDEAYIRKMMHSIRNKRGL